MTTEQQNDDFIARIAAELGETDRVPLRQIGRIIELCGEQFVEDLLAETKAVEEEGGLTVKDGSRRRTVGGVFFYLARGRMSKEQRDAVFIRSKRRKKPKLPPFPWTKRLKLLNALMQKQGRASSVKVTLIGRPKRIRKHGDGVVFEIEQSLKQMGFPRGVPSPPQIPSIYTVYAGVKQWHRVENPIRIDKEDVLIVEGKSLFDPTTEGVAVFATFVTTKAIQMAQRESQRATAQR
jgi:hypothetical protein